MHKTFEEILEAVWTMDEQSDSSLAGIRERCPLEVKDEDLAILEKRRLIVREGDQVTLTYDGRDRARNVVRRHRLAEVLFATILDLGAEEREVVACEVEHNLLPEVEEAICTLLGHPAICPDNKPIPPGRCCRSFSNAVEPLVQPLKRLGVGESGRIAYIVPKDPERLVKLSNLGVIPGADVRLTQKQPATVITIGETTLAIDQDIAEEIYVKRLT